MRAYSDVGSRATTIPDQLLLGCGRNELTFDLMFSKLAGEVREKQSKKTSVWGYDNGRSRL
jgi:hypothetical protein